ncbi:nucleotidyltransferase domain-containing protein [Streptomyces amakusaensis]|uniref:Aminoglycoside adenylyltransferase domain-containing protein n=1 Tax=Streptomyces amakusaensis TaxID=67271 RepID=A0ABW0APJ8_9ACTN
MKDQATHDLLDRFTHGIVELLGPVSVWAHGSLGGGGYLQGRSDLDLIAVLARPVPVAERGRLAAFHRRLEREEPLAAKLHCGYLPAGRTADPARRHLAWAHRELYRRPVTEVTRCELHRFGVVLHGRPPAEVLPPVSEEMLVDFVVRDLRCYWQPLVRKRKLWRQDVWVDLGMLTLARASVTIRTGALISKAEALDVLRADPAAPAEVVEDIRRRRSGEEGVVPPGWIERRAGLTAAFLGPAIDRVAGSARR